jgi:phage-related protein
MYGINFYKDASGNEPVREYLDDLAIKIDKASRITLNKILDYMKILSEHGTRAGEPYVKHIDGDIWELRPRSDRIFFFAWTGAQFILLHHYTKKSQKAPQREIDQAKRNMQDFIDRSDNDEQK